MEWKIEKDTSVGGWSDGCHDAIDRRRGWCERERVNEDEELYNKRRRRKEGDVEKEEIYIYRE